MNVTLCSAFRNASSFLTQHRLQVCQLAYALHKRGDQLHVIWCEGDSKDSTWGMLLSAIDKDADYCRYTVDAFQHHHGQLDYGSVVHPIRFASLAKVCNAIWARIPADADAVIWVESDLIWEPSVMLALLDDLEHVPAVAPMVLLERGGYPEGYWYDSWAFARKGKQVSVMPPYFDDMDGEDDLLELDSAGSVLVMRGNVARYVSWPAEDVIRGVCRQIREHGDGVFLDANQRVTHP